MAHLDLLRTIHLPVSSDGIALKNSFGVVIAQAADPMTAHALAELINLGRAGAEEQSRTYEEAEARKGEIFARTLRSA